MSSDGVTGGQEARPQSETNDGIAEAVPPAMTDEARAAHDALRAEVKRISETKKRPMTEIAKEIGVPYGTFSGWVAGTYKGRVERYDDLVRRWLATRTCAARKRAELPVGPGFVETAAWQAFLAVMEHAQHAPAMTLMSGAAGVGKTTAIEAYRQRSTNVWVITGQPSLSTPRALLDELGDLLGVQEWRSSHRISRAIEAKMRGTRGLLIIDEAQHLGTTTIEQVRSLHDASRVGVVLCGNETVATRIEGGARSAAFAQIFSRVGMRMSRARPSRADIEALLDGWEVADGEVRKLLAAIARKPGALRGMIMTLRMATMQSAAAGEALSARYVELAWQGLGGQASGPEQGGRA